MKARKGLWGLSGPPCLNEEGEIEAQAGGFPQTVHSLKDEQRNWAKDSITHRNGNSAAP